MSYSRYQMPMPMPSPTLVPSYGRSPSLFHADHYPNQRSGTQVVHYNSNNQLHPSQSSSTIDTLNSGSAQQIAHDSQIIGNNLSLIVQGRPILISRASVNAFCTDFVRNVLAESTSLTGSLLEKLERQKNISIHHKETINGDVIKRQFATELPNTALSASIVAAVGDFSQFRDIIDRFFSYTYSESVTSHNTYSTHYYANDEYTVTGCYLYRNIYKKQKSFRAVMMHGRLAGIKYETQCYLFTFKVAQATKFIEKYLHK